VGAPVHRGRLGQPQTLGQTAPAEIPHFWRLAGLATEEAIEFLPKNLPVEAIVYGGDGFIGFGSGKASFRSSSPENRECDVFQAESPLELMREIAERRGHGPIEDENVVSLNNACVTSNQAIGLTFHRVRSGQWTRVLTGAVYGRFGDSELMKFHMLGTLAGTTKPAAQASRPFSKDRSGFVLGEGAATLVLETREAAEKRGAKILGAISGYSSTSDAYRVTDGRPDAKCAAQAMLNALEDAGLAAEQISAVSAHGTSTPMNDRLETMAIKHALGDAAYKVPVISLKSQVGHSVMAAGALEAVACLLMLSEQKLAPTINYQEFDPECDLDYVPNQSRPARVQRIISNNFGFGGQNASVVFEQA
jgi:3-oxoacyl-[acyl-carrier-protein] synthase II